MSSRPRTRSRARDEAANASAASADQSPPRHTPEEEEEYQQKLDTAYKADLLGIDLPPVAPPGHHLQPVIEKPKLTFFNALFKRAENRSALYQLYVTTALMVIVPLSMMGIAYYILLANYADEPRLMWSGFAGVLGVNIITIGFGLFAYYDKGGDDEEDPDAPPTPEEMEAKRKKWTQWELAQEATQSREDRERLQTIREAHILKAGGTLPKPPTEAEAEAEPQEEDESASSSSSSTAKRSLRKDVSRDSALDGDVVEPEPRARRTRSKRA